MHICEYCKKQYNEITGYKRFCSKSCIAKYAAKHVKNHVCNFNKKILSNNLQKTWQCCHCKLIFNTRSNLYKHIHKNHPEFCRINKKTWNAGLTKNNNLILNNISLTLKKKYLTGQLKPTFIRKHTEEQKLKIKDGLYKAKLQGKNVGGYRIHKSGFGKKCIANGEFFDSSWEVAYYFYCKQNNIYIQRNKKEFLYQMNGSFHRYTPDFYDGKNYIEIKGYEDKTCIYKWKAVKNLIVIKNVSKEINYMISKYGKNWLNIICEKIYN